MDTTRIIGITFGIRYVRSFRIPDISGNIVDDILNGDSTPFGGKLYPLIQEPRSREKILSNPKTNDYLRINTDDLIMGVTINENFDKQYGWFLDNAIPFIENHIFAEYKIKNILRIGIIFHHKLSKNDKIQKIIGEITNEKLTSSENINLNFSKRLATTQGLIKKGVEDYKNTIYTLAEVKKDLFADIDYQHYFKPVMEDLRECKTKEIARNAKTFMIDNFYPWLSEYEKKNRS
ncbi:MAG: hypothetical protein WD992_00275 [Candidatus Levyibacteriota bacterium]